MTGGEADEEGADHVAQEGSKDFAGKMFTNVINK